MKGTSTIVVTLTAAFAAVYAVGVVFLAPISYQLPVQVRVADALLPLAILFGWPVIIGVSLGAFIANFFGGLGPVDIVGGSIANFIATYAAWRIARNRTKPWAFVGVAVEILVVTAIVGSYLSYLIGLPIVAGLTGVFLGSVVAMGILGSILLFALSTGRITSLLRAHAIGSESKQK